MDLKQVISQLEDLQGHCQEWWDKDDEDSIWERDVQALGRAIKMVEKEIPKISGCRICDDTSNSRYFENHGYEYCPYCGQKLDWEE